MAENAETSATAEPGQQADLFLVSAGSRLPDRGPRYKETPPDPQAPGAPPIAEPWNAATATLFVVLVLVWFVRLWGRYARYPMIVSCLPILLVGGVGGTLYHAYRSRVTYFLLDVIPISLLGLAAAVYLVIRLGGRFGWKKVLMVSLLVTGAYVFVNGVLFRMSGLAASNPALVINLSYASMAAVIVLPLLFVLVQTRFRHAGWVICGLLTFGVAWFCRLVDGQTSLPMGSHWLWHTFGALATAALIEYFYRIEGRSFSELRHRSPKSAREPELLSQSAIS